MRGTRAATIACALATIACRGGAPTDSLSYREHWELLMVSEVNALVQMRFSTHNTDVLRGQGAVSLHVWTVEQGPISFLRRAAPEDVTVGLERTELQVGSDGLSSSGHGFSARIRSEDVNATFQLDDRQGATTPSPPPATAADESGQWTVTAHSAGAAAFSWVEAGARGGMYNGRGLLLHRGGDRAPTGPHRAVYVLDEDVDLGLDLDGDVHLGWGRIHDQVLDPAQVAQAEAVFDSDGTVHITVSPDIRLTIKSDAGDVLGQVDHYEHLTGPERWAAKQLWPVHARRLQFGVATLTHNDHSDTASAIVVTAPELE